MSGTLHLALLTMCLRMRFPQLNTTIDFFISHPRVAGCSDCLVSLAQYFVVQVIFDNNVDVIKYLSRKKRASSWLCTYNCSLVCQDCCCYVFPVESKIISIFISTQQCDAKLMSFSFNFNYFHTYRDI